jgi:hypothetical protein
MPIGLEADLGEARDQRRGRVVESATEHDLVANAALTDDEHAVGVGRGAGIVGDEDDRLTVLVA